MTMTAATNAALSAARSPIAPTALGRHRLQEFDLPAMPPADPLAMPVQKLDALPTNCHQGAASAPPRWARLGVFGAAWALTLYGTWQMYEVVSLAEVTVLEGLLVILFAVNFSWIALAFTNAFVGFGATLLAAMRRPPARRRAARQNRTVDAGP